MPAITTIDFDHIYLFGNTSPSETDIYPPVDDPFGGPVTVTDDQDGAPDGSTGINSAATVSVPGLGSISVTITGTTASGDPIGFFFDPMLGGNVYALFSDSGTLSGAIGAINTADAFLYCFGPDTMIATPGGERRVDHLQIGDAIQTASGDEIAVKWIGRQQVRPFLMSERAEPVRLRAHALGQGLPHSDLTVTADHGLVLDGLVINAGALVNGDSIAYVPAADLPVSDVTGRFTVYHLETEGHEVLIANGLPAETFIDVAGRKGFENYAQYLELYGVERVIPEMKNDRITTQRLLPEALRKQLGLDQDQERALIA